MADDGEHDAPSTTPSTAPSATPTSDPPKTLGKFMHEMTDDERTRMHAQRMRDWKEHFQRRESEERMRQIFAKPPIFYTPEPSGRERREPTDEKRTAMRQLGDKTRDELRRMRFETDFARTDWREMAQQAQEAADAEIPEPPEAPLD